MQGEEFALELQNGLRLSGKKWGKEDGCKERVLALHGWLDNASTWDGFAPLLTEKGGFMICLDFAGHGRSDHANDYSLEFHASCVIMAAVVLGWNGFVLAGHSMGGAVATLVAGSMPSLVKSLILVEALGPWPVPLTAPLILRRGAEQRLKKEFWKRQPKIYPTPAEAIAKLQENNPQLATSSATVIVTRSLVKVEGGYSFSHDPKLAVQGSYLSAFVEAETRQFILGIRCPTIVFWTQATIDSNKKRKIPVAGNSTVKSLQDILSERHELLNKQCCKVVVLEEGTHHVHLDCPHLVANQVFRFLGLEENLTKAKL